MSASAISGATPIAYDNQTIPNEGIPNAQQFQQEFLQLGSDLQSGDLSAAETDFATLQQIGPAGLSTSSSSQQSGNPLEQAFQQLGKDLQAGNLSAAQQDYTNIQHAIQNQANRYFHHHHHGGGGDDSEMSAISQSFQQLGQALQSGNLSSAQQIYSTLQQEFQQLGQNSGESAAQSSQSSSSVSISA